MKGLLKGLAGMLAVAAITLCIGTETFAATGIYVGKEASAEGTTLIGVSLEAELGMASVPVVIEKGVIRKGDVIESENGFKYEMPEDNARMTISRLMSFAGYNGWNNCASNEYGVSVLSYITTDPNMDAVAADPFVSDGLSEEKMATILASTSKSAREAVMLLCTLIEEKGASTAEIVLIADQDGAWVVENFTGHQYVATKLPDDKIATFSCEPIIRNADPDDKDTVCSADLFTLPEENDFAIYDENKKLDLILTYNADNIYSDEPHLRGWVGHDMFAPSEELEYDDDEAYDVFFAPDEKVSLTQAFDFFRNRFEGTQFDLSDDDNAFYYGINNQFVSGVSLFQIFDDVDEAMSTVLWSNPANPTASPFIAIPVVADSLPESIATDVTEEKYDDDILQLGFANLNNSVIPRRSLFGGSVREYWEGMEALSAKDVTESMRGKWKDAYEASPVKAVGDINDYVEKVVDGAEDDCERLTEEFEWYLFKNGVRKSSVPDEDLAPFECAFDAVAYAHANGWETEIEDDVFTATRDGRTITVGLAGDQEGSVTFTGFDNNKLIEDMLTHTGYTEEAADETADPEEAEAGKLDEEKPEDTDKELADVEKEIEEAEAEVKEDSKEGTKEEAVKEDSEEAESAIEEVASEATQKIEVDTIDALGAYFAEKAAAVPRDGWAENEIAKELNGVSKDVTAIIGKYFNGADIEDLIGFDATRLANDEDIAKVGDKVVAAGMDLSALSERYFASLYEDVSGDVVNGRLTQDGAVKILNEAATDIEGITRLYLEGVAGAFSQVFNTDLSSEEFADTIAELGDGALQLMEDYGAIDLDEMGLGDLKLQDLTDADIEVVITLNEMDDSVIDGLSSLLGVDVRSTLDSYIEAINKSGSNTKIVEEKHEAEKAQSAPDPIVLAAIDEVEIGEAGDDYVVPQEIIDIINEAISEAQAGDGAAEDADAKDTAEEVKETEATADEANTEAAEEPVKSDSEGSTGAFTVEIGKLIKADGKVMLPAYMLKYFN
ncbi:MAG: C69 family dipeptidase [Lachnospiraceae bacterium]|nr:C69 family dipeptidase [Lachnospiraceae bacterium]